MVMSGYVPHDLSGLAIIAGATMTVGASGYRYQSRPIRNAGILRWIAAGSYTWYLSDAVQIENRGPVELEGRIRSTRLTVLAGNNEP